MAALTLPSLSGYSRLPIRIEGWTRVKPQGTEDKQLGEKAQAALDHYRQRSEVLLAVAALGEDYDSVPFEPVRMIRVTYRHVGELKPPPFSLDE